MGTAEEKMDSVKGSASTVADRAKGTASNAADRAQSQMRGNPLAVGLAAFAIGWLIGSLLPASEREKEAAASSSRVRGCPERRRTAPGERAEHRESGRRRGQGAAQRVGEEAKTAAENVREEAKGQAETVREEVKGQAETIRGGTGESEPDDASYPPNTSADFGDR